MFGGGSCKHRSRLHTHTVPLSVTLCRSLAAVEMVETLCALGADVNDRGCDTADTPLLTAACLSSPHMAPLVRLLLQRGADPRLTNIDGKTAVQECKNVTTV